MVSREASFKTVLSVAFLSILLAGGQTTAKNVFTRTFLNRSFDPCKSTGLIAFLDSMKTFGYNGLCFDGHKLPKPKTWATPACKAEFNKAIAHAKKLGITLIPMTQQQGEASYDSYNHSEAFVTKNSRFVAAGALANLAPDAVNLANPGFENGKTGWGGSGMFKADNTVFRSGTGSLLIDSPSQKSQYCTQEVTIKPYTTYEVEFFVKTLGFKKPRDLGVAVKAGGGWVYHLRENQGVGVNQNWRRHRISFNSLGNSKVGIWLVGAGYNTSTGKAWFDDITVKEVGLYETVIRSTTPVVVKSPSGTTYKEGTDYTISVDPEVKKHNQGRLLIPAGSTIKDGDTLLVNWYKLANCVTTRPPASLAHSEAWTIIDNNIQLMDAHFDTPIGRMMKYSEWRISGWDAAIQSQYRNTGDYWAMVISKTEQLYRKALWDREVYIWNDEVDPYHNGEKNAHWIWNGNHGAWKGLSNETVILNWCVNNRDKSMRFFAGIEPEYKAKKNMQRQIIAAGAFAANDNMGAWNAWLPMIGQLENDKANPFPDGAIIGILYHTYRNNYTELDVMRQVCIKDGRWQPEFPFKPRNVSVKPQKTQAIPMTLGLAVHNETVRYDLQYNGWVDMRLVNSLGQTAQYLVCNQRKAAGRHEVRVDRSHLPAGIYFVRLEVDNRQSQLTQKVVLF